MKQGRIRLPQGPFGSIRPFREDDVITVLDAPPLALPAPVVLEVRADAVEPVFVTVPPRGTALLLGGLESLPVRDAPIPVPPPGTGFTAGWFLPVL